MCLASHTRRNGVNEFREDFIGARVTFILLFSPVTGTLCAVSHISLTIMNIAVTPPVFVINLL